MVVDVTWPPAPGECVRDGADARRGVWAVNRTLFRRGWRFFVGCQPIVTLVRLAGGALLFACAKSKQKHTKGG